MCISFPYGIIDEVTSTVSVVPYVTQYEDGRVSTSFSTITLKEDPECAFFEKDQFTWETLGRTLTWPTTYGLIEGFVGRAESTFEPTKTSYGGKDCDGTVGTTAVTLPSTLDQGSFIIPLNDGASSTTFKAGPLPTDVIEYLDSFDTVQQQFNEIPLTSCAPALPVRTACTTILTSISTSVSCSSPNGEEQSCITETATLLETNTHTPHWPTLNGSLTDLKRTAARLTTETAETTTIQATAEPVLAPATDEPTDEPEGSSSIEPPTASDSDAEDSEEPTENATSPTDSATPVRPTTQTETQTAPPSRTETETRTAPTDTQSRPGSNTAGTSQATGSAAVDSSAATFTGAGSNAVARGWSLVLVAGLACLI